MQHTPAVMLSNLDETVVQSPSVAFDSDHRIRESKELFSKEQIQQVKETGVFEPVMQPVEQPTKLDTEEEVVDTKTELEQPVPAQPMPANDLVMQPTEAKNEVEVPVETEPKAELKAQSDTQEEQKSPAQLRREKLLSEYRSFEPTTRLETEEADAVGRPIIKFMIPSQEKQKPIVSNTETSASKSVSEYSIEHTDIITQEAKRRIEDAKAAQAKLEKEASIIKKDGILFVKPTPSLQSSDNTIKIKVDQKQKHSVVESKLNIDKDLMSSKYTAEEKRNFTRNTTGYPNKPSVVFNVSNSGLKHKNTNTNVKDLSVIKGYENESGVMILSTHEHNKHQEQTEIDDTTQELNLSAPVIKTKQTKSISNQNKQEDFDLFEETDKTSSATLLEGYDLSFQNVVRILATKTNIFN